MASKLGGVATYTEARDGGEHSLSQAWDDEGCAREYSGRIRAVPTRIQGR